ncbi:MAG: anion permease [Simkaniaceae bacterium]
MPPPQGVESNAWHLFAIFVFTILGIITKPLPMGAVAFLGLSLTAVLHIVPFEEAFSGFHNAVVWLIVCAFFVARGFIKTGLGARIAYKVIYYLGRSTLGMGYGLMVTDLVLAPAIPSVTARTGGVVYPIVLGLCKVFGSEPHSHPRRIGAYLIQTIYQGAMVSSAMFLTAMAGNPLIVDLAEAQGITITWGSWALAALVPGLVSLLVIPFFLFKLFPPELKKTENAKEFAGKQLLAMGRMTKEEWIMLFSFLLLLSLWVAGPYISMKATIAVLIGLGILLLTKVLTWKDVLEEKGAWDTMVWFAALIMLASYLNKFGLTTWFSQLVVSKVQGMPWLLGFGIISLIYFYSHYFFASSVAHIGAMYPPFLILSIALGTPPALAALVLAFFSSLFGSLTHYGSGPAPILFGSGYVKIGQWWKLGFWVSAVNIVIWLLFGAAWWKILGLY